MAVEDRSEAVRRATPSTARAISEYPNSHPRSFSPRLLARRLTGGGTTGNEQLTALTGIVLVLLLAALGITILRIHPLLSVHMFLGLLLIPPVLLKMTSTGYRFARYYTGNLAYRRKGPPPTILRLIAPVLVASTVVVFASGVALLLVGPGSTGALRTVHKASFIIWLGFTALHVLGHLSDLAPAVRARPRSELRLDRLEDYQGDGRSARILSLGGALVAGVVLAIVFIPEFGPWVHAGGFFDSH
ncbi:MAG: hypothetical protein ACLQMH_13045 [Solirubrobacteraceae bacterium]